MPDTTRLSRRLFLGGCTGVGLLGVNSAVTRGGPAPGSQYLVRLGGPIHGRHENPEDCALEHVRLGYRAAYCPAASLGDPDRIRAISAAFNKQGVVIAEVGRWVNLVDADQGKRLKNQKQVTDGLALAEAVGALCCVDIVGSYSPTSWMGPHPDNLSPRFFDEAVSNARSIIDAVKPSRAKFCYEMMGWSLPDSPESALKLLKAVDRKAFAIHLDPCNLINSPLRFYRSNDLLRECFEKLGPWIVSCHAKDLTWDVEMNIHFREVVPGRGSLDYRTYLSLLASLPTRPPLMLEHLRTPQEYEEGRGYIRKVGAESGIKFE